MRSPGLQIVVVAQIFLAIIAAKAESFDFKRELFDPLSTLSLVIESIDVDTGEVTVNGGDTQQPTTPFTWNWGDGSAPENGWFPRQHTYTDVTKNYVITVTSHYSGGATGMAEILARFVASQVNPVALSSVIEVDIPNSNVSLVSRVAGYYPPTTLTYFDDSFFEIEPRTTIEYVMTVAAFVQRDLVNSDIVDVDGGFKQVILRDPGGSCPIWFTSPVAIGAGDYVFGDTIEYSTLMHEMGHNFTLNSPADYYYGGKIDGWANTIYSESMAQIFQHATTYEIINNAEFYGFGEDIIFGIKQSAISSIQLVRSSYEDYVNSGAHFYSWNNPNTPQDETFSTFMTIAYKFFEQAENSGKGYRLPLKRMMKLLQLFNEDLKNRYDRQHNNPAADTFRATLMVSALSYGFSTDLRPDFEALNFPIDDTTYNELITAAPELADVDNDGLVTLSDLGIICEDWLDAGPHMQSDLNNDKAVNFLDFAELAFFW